MNDAQIFYFHGLPGSPTELDWALPEWHRVSNLKAINRLTISPSHEDVIESLAAKIANHQNVHLIGFSLGAMTALKLAVRLPETVTRVDLIAPATPLELGDTLADMAGKSVFKAANHKLRLGVLTTLQATATRFSPSLMITQMFRGVSDAEKALLKSDSFHNMLRAGLSNSLLNHPQAYKSELRAYVRPWASLIKQLNCETTIWHGTRDTWVPLTGSRLLGQALGKSPVTLNVLDDLGHYSALKQALPVILATGPK